MSDLAFIFGTGRLHFIAVNDFKDTILAGRTSEVFGKTFFQPFHDCFSYSRTIWNDSYVPFQTRLALILNV